LDEVFHLESQRTIGNDWVVRYDNRFLQLERQSRHYAPAKAKVVVWEWENGRIEVRYREQKLMWHEIEGCPVRKSEARGTASVGALRSDADLTVRHFSGSAVAMGSVAGFPARITNHGQ
jgi:hypothetical protein